MDTSSSTRNPNQGTSFQRIPTIPRLHHGHSFPRPFSRSRAKTNVRRYTYKLREYANCIADLVASIENETERESRSTGSLRTICRLFHPRRSSLFGNGNLKRDSYRTTQRVADQNEVSSSGLAERVIIAFFSSVTNGKMTEFRWRRLLVIGSRSLADAEKGSRGGRPNANANATQTRTRSHTRREPALEIRHTFHFLKRLRFPQ